MPESRIRRKASYTPPAASGSGPKPNPRWYVPLMLGLMLVGLVWIVVFYVFEREYPIPGLDVWNLVIGFALIMVGFVMATRWR